MKRLSEHKELIMDFILAQYIIIAVFIVNMDQIHASNLAQNNPYDSPIKISNTSNLSKSITLPIEEGYVNGNISFFIVTDVSEKRIVSSVANTTNYNINFAPSLNNTSESSRQQGYEFTNGVIGKGAFGYQLPVASATTSQEGYSPLFQINYIKWVNEAEARLLKSVTEILDAGANGEITVAKSNIVINSPAMDIK